MSVPRIYQSPDGSGLAIEQPDGEFSEIGRWDGMWTNLGLIEVVPDHWVRLVPGDED